jgi:glycosyltransferase involved in cell wall biosynthesis
MPRVLLYDSETFGHHAVILRYLLEGLPRLGWEPVVVTRPELQALREQDLEALDQEARECGCELVHLLAVDGRIRNWMRPRLGSLSKRNAQTDLPRIGTYYLFNNLMGWRGLGWWPVFGFGYLDRILISDPFLSRRRWMPGLRSRIEGVPDPWSRADFPSQSWEVARGILGLPGDSRVVLVFGEISQRKGVKRILEALRRVRGERPLLVFAGVVLEDARRDLEQVEADPRLGSHVRVFNRHIEEEEVSTFFHAADAVLSDYPKWFRVSSGAFTRTLAAGRIPIVPNHGVLFEFLQEYGFGLSYESESADSLAEAMERLVRGEGVVPADRRLAEEREVEPYCEAVARAYRKTLERSASH